MRSTGFFTAAAAGKLGSRDEVAQQARRMFRSPKSRSSVMRFARQWVDIDRLAVVPKDAATFPTFDTQVRASMRKETERFLEHVLFEGPGTLDEVVRTPSSTIRWLASTVSRSRPGMDFGKSSHRVARVSSHRGVSSRRTLAATAHLPFIEASWFVSDFFVTISRLHLLA
jgi:hypothetical protein